MHALKVKEHTQTHSKQALTHVILYIFKAEPGSIVHRKDQIVK